MSGSFIIIKNIQTVHNTQVPVVILDDLGEVMEFQSKEEAEKIKEIFQRNSDSGHTYVIREIKNKK
jgi:hypothetical protein